MPNLPPILRPEYYFDLDSFEHRELFSGTAPVWEAIKRLQDGDYVRRLVEAKCQQGEEIELPECYGEVHVHAAAATKIWPHVVFSGEGGAVSLDEGADIRPGTCIDAGTHCVYIGKNTVVGPHAHLDARQGPIYVGDNVVLRHGAFIRELSVISNGSLIGNSCEIRCSIIGEEAEILHFNYVGDSIIGRHAVIGAGVMISNRKLTAGDVTLAVDGEMYDSGLRRFGVIMGDYAQMGCNAVANPGTLIGKHALVYAATALSGVAESLHIVKLRQTTEEADFEPGAAT